jgi:hypothetical protein
MARRTLTSPEPSPDRTDVITLDEWAAVHGPLSPPAALLIALDTCSQASQMADADLGAVIESLNMARIIRSARGGWSWLPSRGESGARRVRDAEVIARLGAILFHSLTGQALPGPSPGEQEVRAKLRSLRPALAAGVADLTVRAVSARLTAAPVLMAFARDLRQLLGIERNAPPSRRQRAARVLAAVTGLTLVLVTLVWLATPARTERLEASGLTRRETTLVDVTEETAQAFAVMDEHTAAIQEYQQIARWWSARIAPEDPLVTWNGVHEGWVRNLAGDRITAEQRLTGAPSRLGATLWDLRPYTRAVRLELAATLEARGALAQAATLRNQADQATRHLLGDTSSVLADVPAPPGVLAHLAPNAPEREGFRRTNGSGFFVPLTSIQRLLAGRDGWRLHLLASGACRASVVTGNIPRRIAVDMTRAAGDSWEMRVEGVTPPLTMRGAASEKPGVSLVANGTGSVEVRLWDGRVITTKIDAAAPAPDPPYTFAFGDGTNGSGCALVCLEIPFPFQP